MMPKVVSCGGNPMRRRRADFSAAFVPLPLTTHVSRIPPFSPCHAAPTVVTTTTLSTRPARMVSTPTPPTSTPGRRTSSLPPRSPRARRREPTRKADTVAEEARIARAAIVATAAKTASRSGVGGTGIGMRPRFTDPVPKALPHEIMPKKRGRDARRRARDAENFRKYMYLRRLLKPWSDNFRRKYGHTPTLVDVHDAAIPGLLDRFIEYLDAVEALRAE